MEWIGWVAFIVAIYGSSKAGDLEKKVKKLEKMFKADKMKKDKKDKKDKKGESDMSKIIAELVGKKCYLKVSDGYFEDYDKFVCEILAVDEEWIKFTYMNKKLDVKTRIIRIEEIEHVDLVEE